MPNTRERMSANSQTACQRMYRVIQFAVKLFGLGIKTFWTRAFWKNLTLFNQPIQGFLHSFPFNVLEVISTVQPSNFEEVIPAFSNLRFGE